MFTTVVIIYGAGFLLSKGIGNKTEDSLKWSNVLYKNLKKKK